LSAGRAITSEDQCTSNQALPYHEIKGHPSVQMYLARRPSEILSLITFNI